MNTKVKQRMISLLHKISQIVSCPLIAPSLVLVPVKRTYSLNHMNNYAFGREHVLPEPTLRDHHDSMVRYTGKGE